ncbi:hypothetical protein CHU98_g8575, partial [Xylaria longipes]
MAATLFYLVRNPSALEKASEEVRAKFGDVEEIAQGSQLNSCTYLRACIDEAMRMSPSVGGIAPREVLQGGITIDGELSRKAWWSARRTTRSTTTRHTTRSPS